MATTPRSTVAFMMTFLLLSSLLFCSDGRVQATGEVSPRAADVSRELAVTQNLAWGFGILSQSPFAVPNGTKVVFKYNEYGHDVWRFANQTAWETCNFQNAKQICNRKVTKCPIKFNTVGSQFFGCKTRTHCSRWDTKIEIYVYKRRH